MNSGLENLTRRERELAQLLGDGLTQAEAARVMGITRAAVHQIAWRLRRVLGVSTTEEAVALANALELMGEN